MSVIEAWHGSHEQVIALLVHAGQCFTEDAAVADSYARGGVLAEVEIDTDGLVVEWLEVGYDADEDVAPGDYDLYEYAERGIDVIVYSDSDESGGQHRTWRLVSDAAVAAVDIIEVSSAPDHGIM